MSMYSVFKCQVSATVKYVRATSAEHAALILARWYQVESGTEPREWTQINVAGVRYKVQAPSGYVEKC